LSGQDDSKGVVMIQTVEAIVDSSGHVQLLGTLRVAGPCRAFVTVLEEPPSAGEAALLAEAALATDWLRPEEDAAWSHLQSGK